MALAPSSTDVAQVSHDTHGLPLRWYGDITDQLYGTLKHTTTGVIEVWAGSPGDTTQTLVFLHRSITRHWP